MARDIPLTSDQMETYYENNPDPWENGSTKLYERLLPNILDNIKEQIDPYLSKNHIEWFDFGIGGGNVVHGFKEGLKTVFDKEDIRFSGCDISKSAIERLESTGEFGNLYTINLDEMTSEDPLYKDLGNYDVLSMIEVIYYFGKSIGYKVVLDNIWSALKSGAVLIVGDGLVRNQYRDYLSTKEDSELIVSYNDHIVPICKEVSDSGKSWTRYMKVRIYKKL